MRCPHLRAQNFEIKESVMLVLRSENVGNFQRMQEIGKTVGAYSAGWPCRICIHGFSYDHHYRAASQARALAIYLNTRD